MAASLSGWGAAGFDALADRVLNASSDEGGRSLEELTSRLHRKTEGDGQGLVNARHLVGRQSADARFQAALIN